MAIKDFLEFGPFRADVRGRTVLRQGELVPLPGKAFEVLLVLLQKQGETVSKDELMKAVWPDTFVEEGNLTQTIFVLRKALGDAEGQSFIITIPRQGYRFASEVRSSTDQETGKSTTPPEKTPPPRRSVQWAWVVAGVLAGIGAAGWYYALRTPKTVPSPLMSLSLDLGREALASISRPVTISPDGTRIVFRIRRTDGKTMLAMRSLDLPSSRATITPLPGTVDASERFFSPDGQWLAFVAGRKLRKISMQGGAPSTICDVSDFAGGSWGENNQIIAVLGSAVGLFRIDARGGEPQLLAKPADHKEALWAWPQILPGGDAVIYTANQSIRRFDEATIEVLSLKSRQWKTLQRGAYYGRYLSSGHLVWVRNRTLFGARFDPVRLEMKSTPVAVIEEDLASMPDWGAGQFDFSDTGTLVYGSGGAERSIVWMDSEGKTQPLIATAARYRDPSLSPDGKFLAVATGLGQSEILIFDLERKVLSQRTFMKDCRIPAWTSDGRHILFACTADKEGTIWWVRADGSGEPYALYKAPGSVERFSLSPDGRTLLAVTHENEILSIALDTTDPDHPKAGPQKLFCPDVRAILSDVIVERRSFPG